MSRIELPVFYYRDHFFEFLDLFQRLYSSLLDKEELQFLETFHSLPEMTQALAIRFLNRKKAYYTMDDANYSEIESPDEAFDELISCGFLDQQQAFWEHPYEFFLSLSKSDLSKLIISTANIHMDPKHVRKLSKDGLFSLALQNSNYLNLESFLIQNKAYTVRHRPSYRFFLFLFFNTTEKNLQSYALKDLGLVYQQSFQLEQFTARYTTRDQALAAYKTGIYYNLLKKLMKKDLSLKLYRDLESSLPPREKLDELDKSKWDKFYFRLGHFFEGKEGEDSSIEFYKKGHYFKARLKTARSYLKKQQAEKAIPILNDMLKMPKNPDEYIFAEREIKKLAGEKALLSTTETLKQVLPHPIGDEYKDRPEEGVRKYFESKGYDSFHAENNVWRMLFGLSLWPLLFEGEQLHFHHPFQVSPSHVRKESFYQTDKQALNEWLDVFFRADKGLSYLQQQYSKAASRPNGFFNPDEKQFSLLKRIVESLPPKTLKDVVLQMTKSIKNYGKGFPDLITFINGEINLIEVKSPNDHLSPTQLFWQNFFLERGVKSSIFRIKWSSPKLYAVVDIETTGARAEFNKITEIAIIISDGKQVLEQYSTLINPKRKIPAKIQAITGINDEMVLNEPTFAQVADKVDELTKGKIFVAHNASFDYSFLQNEFKRLGRDFNRECLCTLQTSRRELNEIESYSLASLCHVLNIELVNHHRALDDALATTELLHHLTYLDSIDALNQA